MNLFFGVAGASANGRLVRAQHYIGKEWGSASDTAVVSDGLVLGWVSDGGSVLGVARAERRTCVLLGFITGQAGNPDAAMIGEPQQAAAWLLSRFDAMGPKFLDGVTGNYAVAVLDEATSQVLFASDPGSGRSLFTATIGNDILFATNIGLLAAIFGDDLRVDREYEDFFLIYGFYPFGRTVFEGVQCQAAGEVGIGSSAGLSVAKIELSAPPSPGIAPESESDVIEALYSKFIESTRALLPARRQRVAVLLGGFDSALVASAIHRLGYQVETYSFYYEDSSYNQPYTDTLADYLGIRHHWIDISRELIETGLERFATVFNQPTNWPNYVIQTAHVCDRMRADGITLCYSGDGCDTVFLGYPGTYRRARLINAMPSLPKPLSNAAVAIAAHRWADRAGGHPYRVAMGLLRGLGRSPAARSYLSFRILDELSLEQLKQGQPQDIDTLVEELSAPHSRLSFARRAYLGKAAVSPNRSKMLASADLTGVTILSPYMHPALKQFALALPVELMRPANNRGQAVTGKYILARMAEEKGLLPAEVIFQPKVAAVDAPIDEWYAGPMRPVMKEIFRDLPFDYDERYVDDLLDEKMAERIFKRHFMIDNVISHAPSLLATYARFAARAQEHQVR